MFGPVPPARNLPSWREGLHPGSRPEDIEPYTTQRDLPTLVAASAFDTEIMVATAFLLLFIATLLLYAQYSGAVRWLIVLLLLAAVAYVLFRLVGLRTRDPSPLVHHKAAERHFSGGLQSLTATYDRASDGFKHSQLEFAILMKDTFLEKVRVSRDLVPADIHRLVSSPETLSALIDDRELIEFLISTEQKDRNWSTAHQWLRAERGFARRMDSILAKMEAWE